jgi:hypothetical protein
MAYGSAESDFARLANFADINLRNPKGHRSGITPEWRPASTVNPSASTTSVSFIG